MVSDYSAPISKSVRIVGCGGGFAFLRKSLSRLWQSTGLSFTTAPSNCKFEPPTLRVAVPKIACALERHAILTAAPLSPRFFRHRRRSATKQVIRPRAHNPRNRYSFLLLLQEKSSNTGGVEGFLWLREADLNHQPSGYEPDELPDCSIPRYLA